MCFSPEASFTSAGLVGAVGVASLAKVRYAREVLLGALPLMFAVHELEEGMVWLGLEGKIGARWEHWSIWLYILFAHALVIAIAPWSIWLIEPDKRHGRLFIPFVVLGTALCGFALWRLSGADIVARIRVQGIEYSDPLIGVWWFLALYVVATCVPPFLSSFPWMIVFGALNLCGLVAAALIERLCFTSVWCLFAALLSILIYMHFHRVRRLHSAATGLAHAS